MTFRRVSTQVVQTRIRYQQQQGGSHSTVDCFVVILFVKRPCRFGSLQQAFHVRRECQHSNG